MGKPTSSERGWALRWVRGSIASYILGRTRLEVVKGRVRRAVESYGVSFEDIKAVVSSLLLDPLLDAPRELKEERVRPLMGFIKHEKKVNTMVKCLCYGYENWYEPLKALKFWRFRFYRIGFLGSLNTETEERQLKVGPLGFCNKLG